MQTINVRFKNTSGLELGASLSLPIAKKPDYFILFAHCFTCGKNSRAAVDISRRLTQKGFGVLRVDFTGLGASDGSFDETNFTTNLSDLKSAAQFLEKEHRAPSLLIGHSLGGTAVLYAAQEMESVRAVCTIGAPMEPSHVVGLFKEHREEIMRKGKGQVDIGGRPFVLSADFIKDVESQSSAETLRHLRKALLILHSPQDAIVSIDNAAQIYRAAFHPKSFVSLDGANHLLTKREDSFYAAEVIAAWAQRYFAKSTQPSVSSDIVTAYLGNDGFTTEISAGEHALMADEPKEVGGNDLGASPYQLLSAALGACTAMTLRMYANHKGLKLNAITAQVQHIKKVNPDNPKQKRDVFIRTIDVVGNVDETQRTRLLEIANRCPVHRTLSEGMISIETEWSQKR